MLDPKPSSHRPTRPPGDVQSGPIDATLRCDAFSMAQNRVPHGLLIEKYEKILKIPKTNYNLWFCSGL